MTIHDYLTVIQAARELGVTEGAVRDAIRRGTLPYEEALGRKVILRSDVDKYKTRTQLAGHPKRGRPRKEESSNG